MQVSKVLLVFLALASVALARTLRCPPEIATNSFFANRISPSKYFRCTSQRLLEDYECKDGMLFDPDMLICHKPISGRCGCPTTTECPCPTTTTTTQCPPTTPCPCPPETPCSQTNQQQNLQVVEQHNLQVVQQPNLQIVQQQNQQKPCENCVQGQLQTTMPGFAITSPPIVSYDKFGVPAAPPGSIIVTDPPPPPCE